MKEYWKIIKYFDNYEVSNLGNVRIITSKKLLKFIIRGDSKSICLQKDDKKKTFLISFLLKEYFNISPIIQEIENFPYEEWKVIREYPSYQISTRGRIKTLKVTKEIILKTQKDKKQRERISLSKNNKSKTFFIYRLLAEAFLPNSAKKPQVIHIDGDLTNNSLKNLQWSNNSNTIKNAYRVGSIQPMYSEKNPAHTPVNQYTADGLILIKEWKAIADVERFLGIAHSNISKVCRGKRMTAGGWNWKYPEK